MRVYAPIVVFGYNRPDHLRRTLDTLSKSHGANESDLWVFCDGPKPGAPLERIHQVRHIAIDEVWNTRFRTVQVVESVANQGLANSIINGVTRVFEASDRVIVLEDDLLVAPDFLHFMNDCLEFYRDDQRVGSVTGFSPLSKPPPGYDHDVMAVPRNCSHGWATWADRWSGVDWGKQVANTLWHDPGLRSRLNSAGNDRLDRLLRQLRGEIDSWSIRFGLWQTLDDRITIYPVDNRVRNIGFDDTGIHTRHGQEVNPVILEHAKPYKLTSVSEDPAILGLIYRIYSGPWYRRIPRGLRAYFRGLHFIKSDSHVTMEQE